MQESAGLGLVASIFGGVVVAAANWLFSRDKARAEAQLARAQADKTYAETEKIRSETTDRMKKPWTSNEQENPPEWGEPPRGWRAGDLEGASKDYVVGVDSSCFHSGRAAAYIRAANAEPEGFGVLSQRFQAHDFLGSRLRLSGHLRVSGVTGWAGLWMRVDGRDGELQKFDNMEQRPVKGTSEWVRRDVVLDIPVNVYAIAIGCLLVGPGRVWMDDLELSIVGPDVPTTVTEEVLLNAPVNLAFEEQ
jgi:hypothetical protein